MIIWTFSLEITILFLLSLVGFKLSSIELKDDEIDSLKGELSAKDKIIGKLQAEKERLKQEIHKFKDFWHSIMGHFHKRICYDNNISLDFTHNIICMSMHTNIFNVTSDATIRFKADIFLYDL